MNRLSSTTEKGGAADCDVLIEAAPEDEDLKKGIFKEMDGICPEHAVLATNTSAIPITKLGNVTRRPEKVIGMHFMNPVPVMKLVEVVRAYLTSDETYETAVQLARTFGKEVVTAQDFPGFMSTRLVMPFMNEALYQLYEGRGTKEDIDKCAKMALNHPMGPFEWMDFVGLDSMLHILTNLYDSYGNQRYFPCPLLVQMVQAGHLGRKTGRGFYDYSR
jgi:3-hydroxybutyryl-CoA dehydrogenase